MPPYLHDEAARAGRFQSGTGTVAYFGKSMAIATTKRAAHAVPVASLNYALTHFATIKAEMSVRPLSDDAKTFSNSNLWHCSRLAKSALEEFQEILDGQELECETDRNKNDNMWVCAYFVALLQTTWAFFKDRDLSHDLAVDTVLKVRNKSSLCRLSYDAKVLEGPSSIYNFKRFVRHVAFWTTQAYSKCAGQKKVAVSWDIAKPDTLPARPMPSYFEKELEMAWNKAYSQLQGAQKAVMGLHVYDGLKFAQIAESLGMEENAVRQCAYRARQNLLKTGTLAKLVSDLRSAAN